MESNLLEGPVSGSTVLGLLPVSPQPRETWGWRFGTSAAVPFWARTNTTWFLQRCHDVPGDVTDTAVLVVSELVTNAYTAATALTEESPIDLSLRLFDDRLLVEVIDASPGVPVQARRNDAAAEHGRGLALVSALSNEWGYFWHRDRKVVYAVLLLQEPGPA
jgi:anti-sigma regulatory factor (Ser/Thr protein kinase)